MKKQGIFFIAIGIVLIFFLTGCYVFHQVGWMDSLVLQFLEMIRSDTMHSIMLFFTNVFYGPIYFLLISIVVIWLWITKHRKEAFYFVLVLILLKLFLYFLLIHDNNFDILQLLLKLVLLKNLNEYPFLIF